MQMICNQTVRVLRHVEGVANRFNDIIYRSPKQLPQSPTDGLNIVCYFGGDVQDYREQMVANKADDNLLDYCLENMSSILSDKFMSSHVLVIRANQFRDNTYAIYDNFVVSDRFGSPKHEFSKQSLTHFRLLLLNCFNQMQLNVDLKSNELVKMVGFSKGCVVLNQLLHSFYVSTDDSDLTDLISKIECMYWCDGGHSGGAHTWITSQPVLNHLATLGIGVHINVTPYQILCPFRPWIANEEKIFFQTLTQLGVNPQRMVHFAGQDISLDMHFNIMHHFD